MNTLKRTMREARAAAIIATTILFGSSALAGPGFVPGYSRGANPAGAPDVIEQTFYANSPLGLRPDPIIGAAGAPIDTGAALRKFIDVLPSVPGLAPTTNAGSGSMALTGSKYIPLAVPKVWPTDSADYYHLAMVEYQEQMHSDLPKASVLRGYVQIEEPGESPAPAGSHHVALFYPNGTAMQLPDANGVLQPVYAYDRPHYLGPMIVATKNHPTRIKYSNLLPVGDATGLDQDGHPLGNGVAGRNGDLPLPVDKTLGSANLQQNRVDVHLHGGLTPWISDGSPHQWTIPVGDSRYGYLSDIAVTTAGSGYSPHPTITIDPPQSVATATAVIDPATTGVSYLKLTNPGAFFSASAPPAVTITPPTLPASAQATATGTAAALKVASLTVTNGGSSYGVAPPVTISAPTGVAATATATSALKTTGTAAQRTQLAGLTLTAAGSLYDPALPPVVTIPAPQAAVDATATLGVVNGSLSSVTVNRNFGYYGTAPTLTVSTPPAASNATASAAITPTGTVSGVTLTNTSNWGYWAQPTVTLSAPPAAVSAGAVTATMSGGSLSALSMATPANFGYFTAPTVNIPAPPPAVSAGTVTATLTGAAVSALTMSTPANFGYLTPPTVTISPPSLAVTATASAAGVNAASGALTGVTLGASGAAYTAAPTVSIAAPPAAVPASATAVVTGGVVTGLTLTNGGYGYWSPATVTIGAAPAAGARATVNTTVATATGALTTTVSNGGSGYTAAQSATALTISAPPAAVNAGLTSATTTTSTLNASGGVASIGFNASNFGYWTAPTVTIAVPSGTFTRATATVTTLRAVTITNAGAGYTTAPAVTFTGTPTSGTAWTATATISAGKVTAITISGTGVYATAPTLAIAAPANVRATAVATISQGKLTGFMITNAGAGYTTAPVVTLSAGPVAGTQAAGTITVTNGAVSGITLTNAGRGYSPTTPPTVTVPAPLTGGGTQATATTTVANGRITGLTITAGGSGYTSTPTVTFSAPTAGTQATATATYSAGAVTAVTMTSAGSGYDPTAAVPAITIAAPTGGGTPATAIATVANGVLTGFTITNPGSGYASPPTVTVSAPTPSVAATAVANVSAGVLTGFAITNAGSNYLSAPTVTLSSGPTASATATATATLDGNGKVTGFRLVNAGANYVTAPTVTVSAAAPSVRATVTATIGNGVLGVSITNRGSGYSAVSPPTISGLPLSTPSIAATATATVSAAGAISGVTLTNAGQGYITAPTVTIADPPRPRTATATSAFLNGVVTSLSIVDAGWGYVAAPTVTVGPAYSPNPATATAVVASDGTIAGFNLTSPGGGYDATHPPSVSIAWPARARQATAALTVTAGALTGVSLTDHGGGYLATPNVTVTDAGSGLNGVVHALAVMPTGPSFRQVPDMVGAGDAGTRPAFYTAPTVGEGTLYYTNNQSSRLMWYHDHTSGITRLNVYEGMAAPYLLRDPAVDPALPALHTTAGTFDGLIPEEIIPLIIQDKTFVPKDVALQDARWDTSHWGQYGDLWFPHVYETNQNPAMLASASAAGRWDWGPWFAVVYPSMYALPSGRYGDETTTPEAYEDSALVNGVAFPTVSVEPRAYRFYILNAANDRFLNLGIYKADALQVRHGDPRDAGDVVGVEIKAGPAGGDQPGNYTGNPFSNLPGLTPWPTDLNWKPLPSEMGPSMIQTGNEGGLLPFWVEQPAVPVSFDYNRRSITVLNVSQDNDVTQACYPKCHGLYVGPAMRADVVIDFAPYAGQTLILYNDNPAPNPGFDPRIDYFTDNDPGNAGNYATGGAPSTIAGYGPNTRTVMQIKVAAQTSTPIDYVTALNAGAYNPTALGFGHSIGNPKGTPGVMQKVYADTQDAPIVGAEAYNVVGMMDQKPIATFATNYIDQYADKFLASANEPAFFVTNPGPLTLVGVLLSGNTTSTGGASGIGTGTAPVNGGAGTGYLTDPTVRIDPPGCDPVTSGRVACHQAVAVAHAQKGQVMSIDLIDPGAGYTEVPKVAIISNGQVVTLSTTNVGAGYTVGSTVPVTIDPPTPCVAPAVCVQATASATVNADGSLALLLGTGGTGYTTAPNVTIAPPPQVSATGTSTVAAGSVSAITVSTPGSYAPSSPVTVSVAAPPAAQTAGITAAVVPLAGGGFCCTLSITNPGRGYTAGFTATITDPTNPANTSAQVTATVTNGQVTSVLLTGYGLTYGGAQLTVPAPPAAVPATATALADGTGSLTSANVTITNPGTGYTTAPAVTFSGGTPAVAQAGIGGGGGSGAFAVAIGSTTRAFAVAAAVPNSGVPLVSGSTLANQTITLPQFSCSAGSTTCPTIDWTNVSVGRLMNPAIQELFEPFYGRMNATLGIEMPNSSLQVQTTLPLNYVDPATEKMEAGTVQMWKVTHNGVDTHPVHFHLVNVQVINRVGWDGTVKPPEDNEYGWRETVTMNPLEDIFVVMRAAMPVSPFGIDHSYRAEDPSQPLGVNLGFTQFSVEGLNGTPTNGFPVAASAYGANAPGLAGPTTVVNGMEEYDNEYVWHCHILGHEENDFMRAISVAVQTQAPPAPTGFTASQASANGPVSFTWVDPTPYSAQTSYGNPQNELGFKVERSLDSGTTWVLAASAPANATTAVDIAPSGRSGQVVQYRVYGYNVASANRLLNADPNSTGMGATATTSVTLK